MQADDIHEAGALRRHRYYPLGVQGGVSLLPTTMSAESASLRLRLQGSVGCNPSGDFLEGVASPVTD